MSEKRRTTKADLADPRALSGDELRALIEKSPKIGARVVESAAKYGLLSAQMMWARMLLIGHGVPRDRDAAFRWFEIAAESADPDAINMLGRCYEMGWGTEPDRAAAAEHYRAAARRDLVEAQYNLGQLLLTEEPGQPQRREGLGWHLLAARSNYLKSMNVIGRFCEEGWEMPKSIENATGWYRKAAEGGDHWGQFNLGRLLAEEGNIAEAAIWFRSAADSRNEEFLGAIEPVLRDRPEPEFQAIAELIVQRRHARKDAAETLAAPPSRRVPRHRRGKSWFARRSKISAP